MDFPFQIITVWILFNCEVIAQGTGDGGNSGGSDCWWTGCQPNSWAVVGCEQYERTERARDTCDGGFKYHCCKENESTTKAPTSTAKPEGRYTECWRTGCQQSTWAVVGCEQYQKVAVAKYSCNGGLEYDCCKDTIMSEDQKSNVTQKFDAYDTDKMLDSLYKPVLGESKLPEYVDYVKGLLISSKGFSVDPDPFPCTDLDPMKTLAVAEGKSDAIRVCDLCPYFPFEKLPNRLINLNASTELPNSAYIECVATCLNRTTCVALSYDSEDRVCYLFNSTKGEIFEEANFTSVIITQPKGVIRDWLYSRNTKISGNKTKEIAASNFFECLDFCSKDTSSNRCNAVSFQFSTKMCTLYNRDNFTTVDYEYGHVAGITLNVIHANDSNRWRFSLYNNLEESEKHQDNPVLNTNSSQQEYGSVYNKACLIQPLSGCDQNTGFQKCYFPEYNGTKQALPVCPDSRHATYAQIKLQKIALEKCMTQCTSSENCRGVEFSAKDLSCGLLDYEQLMKSELGGRKPYILIHPLNDTKLEKNFNLFFGVEIAQLSGSPENSIITMEASTADQCLQFCYKSTTCSLTSFNPKSKKCLLSHAATITKKDSNVITFSRLSDLKSSELAFVHLLSTGIEGNTQYRIETECQQNNCQSNKEICFRKCLENPFCKFVGVKYTFEELLTRSECTHYGVNDPTLSFDLNQEVYVRSVNSISLKLTDLDKMAIFQPNDFYSCFRKSSKQTQSTLQRSTTELESPSSNNGNNLRVKRGFGDWIKKAFNSVVDGFKQIVNDVKDTFVKTGETIKKVFKGDFKGAAESFVEIPIVRDVKRFGETAVELIDNVSKGNWEEAGKGVLDLGTQGIGFIPGPGKIVGKVGGKIISNSIEKGAAKSAGKNVDIKAKPKPDKKGSKDKDNVKDKDKNKDNHKDKDKNKDKDKDKENNNHQCRRRKARVTTPRPKPGSAKPKKTTSCNPVCKNTGVKFLDRRHKTNCQNKDPGDICELICKAGYEESEVTPRCKERNNDAFWDPALSCKRLDCTSSHAVIDVKVSRGLLQDRHINGYFIKFDKRRRLPVFSATFHDSLQYEKGNLFRLNKKKRTESSSFTKHPCMQLFNDQPGSKKNDFKLKPALASKDVKSWDKGHLTPFNHQTYSYKSAISTNLYVNIAPQDPYTNQQPWKDIEADVMCNLKNKVAIILTGVCERKETDTVSGLDVPSCFWKLICLRHPHDGSTIVYGYIADNSYVSYKNATATAARAAAVKTFRSQNEIVRVSGVHMYPAWLEAARYIYKGERLGIPFSPDPWKCASEGNLNPAVFPPAGRKKRQTGFKLGCSDADRRELLAFLSSLGEPDGSEDLEESDDEDGDGEDNSENEEDQDDGRKDGNSFNGANCGKRLIGYYPSWGTARFTNVQGKALTHAVFAFFQTFEDGSLKLGSADPSNTKNYSEDLEIAQKRLANFRRIKENFPHLRTMFAIGGWENSNYFSRIAADPGKRLRLIASTLEIIDTYNFDGIDIDWEHPVTGGAVEGIPEDKQNYVTLMEEMRNAFTEHEAKTGRINKLLISFAGAAGQWTLDPGLDLPNMLKYADWANVMSYDYFGAWASKWGAYTGPPSPLYFGNPKGFSGKVNADWSLKYYVCRTGQPHKINMGVPFYGRFWKNVGDPIDPKDGMWRKAEQVNGVFEGGFVPWKEIKQKYLNDPGFAVTMHEKAKVPFAYNPSTKTFLGFENPESLAFKVKYAEEKNLGGLMIWAIDQDDDEYSMLDTLLKANLCSETNPTKVNHRCPPIQEKRWWTPEDGYDKAGMCGKSAPLFQGYYPVCDPDDPGYSCCGAFGYCGSGPDFCDCPTCVDYLKYPEKIIDEPIKPTVPVNWYFLNDEDGKRGRCGRDVPLLNNKIPICNPDDKNGHCCSNGGYCGSSAGFCNCDTCIDFSKNPNYEFKPKRWWSWSDGQEKSGKCGASAPKIEGNVAECDPESKDAYCCSQYGSCGKGADFCDCVKCVNYKT